MKLLVKNGTLINPKTHINQKMDILIENDLIAAIESNIEVSKDIEIIDATGLIVSPGFIDLHVHLREPGYENKETIETGTKAAAKGGVTTVACMPNTSPSLDSVEVIMELEKRISKTAHVRVLPIGAITKGIKGIELTNHEELIKAGVIGLSDDGRTTMDESHMKAAFFNAKKWNVPVITHSEDHEITDKYKDSVYPIEAEYKIVERDINICRESDGILHVAHVSGERALKAIENAKKDGLKVTCEVAPHHFALNDEMIDVMDTLSKVNPPIRSKIQQEAVLEAIKKGVIDIIATDHAPHELSSKEKIYAEATYGISGIETSFSIAYTALVLGNVINLERLIEMMTCKPAEIGRIKNIGSIEVGYNADLVLLDIGESYVISPEEFISKGKNTPFKGMKVYGEVNTTIYGGKVIYSK